MSGKDKEKEQKEYHREVTNTTTDQTEKKECIDCKKREIRCELDVEFRRMCLKTNRNCFEPKKDSKKEFSWIRVMTNASKAFELHGEYETLLEVHMETIKKYQDKSIECDDLKNEIVEELKGMKYELGTNYFDYYILKWEEK